MWSTTVSQNFQRDNEMTWLTSWFGRKNLPPAQISGSELAPVSDNWRNSPMHLAGLERFLSIRDAASGVPDFWEQSLGMPPQRMIDWMLALGLLEAVPLLESVEYCH